MKKNHKYSMKALNKKKSKRFFESVFEIYSNSKNDFVNKILTMYSHSLLISEKSRQKLTKILASGLKFDN